MGALAGLKILDFTTLLPGPFATLTLADLGAEVLKISAGGKPDLVADAPPMVGKAGVSANQAWLGRNKRTMFLDLKQPEAVEIVKRLAKDYDIVIEQFRPGVMARLGLCVFGTADPEKGCCGSVYDLTADPALGSAVRWEHRESEACRALLADFFHQRRNLS